MPVRLNEESDGAISADKMRCGQIAVIADGPYEGRVVQRFVDSLVSIGRSSGSSFACGAVGGSSVTVRILPNGTTLTIEGNE